MKVTDFKKYYVTLDRNATGYNVSFEIYGVHDTVESALVDQLNRAYKFNQRTALHAIKHNNEIVRLNGVQA